VCKLVYDVCTKVLDRTVKKRERESLFREQGISLADTAEESAEAEVEAEESAEVDVDAEEEIQVDSEGGDDRAQI